jgi:hypothetical protein
MTLIRQNAARVAGPLDQLNDPGEVFKNPGQLEFVRTLVRMLKDGFSRVILRDQAVNYFHLLSPSGKAYRVTVTDDGQITAEYIQG